MNNNIDTRLVPYYTNLENLHTEYLNNLKAVIEKNLGNRWTVTYLGNNSMRIGFIKGYWENGNPNYQDFDLYFGHDWGEKTDYRFEMNTCCFGSFNIEGENVAKTYYIGVGKLLSDEAFQKAIKMMANEYYEKYSAIEDEIIPIKKTIEDERIAAQRIEEEKKNAEIFEQQKIKMKNPENTYAVIFKGCDKNNNFIYRNAPVELIELFDSYSKATSFAKYNSKYYYVPTGCKYAVVETAKLKIA